MFWMNEFTHLLCMAEIGEDASAPGFTQSHRGEAGENGEDEAIILGDQDQTLQHARTKTDENMGAKSTTLEPMEDEPSDFMRGEVDVKEQMDRAAGALESSVNGYLDSDTEDSVELSASFEGTPGGLEEVAEKTDEDLARAKGPVRRLQKNGHETGALTDIGAGRSGVVVNHKHTH